MAYITVTVDTNIIKPAGIGGKPDALLAPWFEFGKGQKNVLTTTVQATGKTSMQFDSAEATGALLSYILGKGGTVDDAPIFIKMDTTKYATNVPEGISNHTYVNDAEETVTRTWADWHDATHTHMTAADGDKIVPGNSFGVELTSAELLILAADNSYTLYLGHEVGALLPTESGE